MNFRTKIQIKPREPKIGYDSQVLLLGSCFVENIGRKLDHYRFKTLQNPFGILFHPTAIATFLHALVEKKEFREEDIFFHNERWHSFDAHSALSRANKEDLLHDLNSAVENTLTFFENTTHIVLTLGTSWGYWHKSTNRFVANCHKIPQKEFAKELMDVDSEVETCIDLIQEINPRATIIFTVSPVRHLKDGFVENQQSKARLITAVHRLVSLRENVQYYPSYEIMMDELRDYRFYSEDMIHPNQMAVDYIWEKFTETYITPKTTTVMEEVDQIQKGLRHRPFNENSDAHQKFLKNLQEKKISLQEKFPWMQF